MNYITNWPNSKKWMKALNELLGYISKLGNNKPTQKKVQHFSISKYQYHKCGERR
jgi:hypothetical protein